MLIKDRLKMGEHIKLGACGGEFIVCETVDNNTYKKIERYLEETLRRKKARLKEVDKEIEDAKNEQYIERLIIKKMKRYEAPYEEAKKTVVKRIEHLPLEKERLEQTINAYKPLSKRLLIDEYDSITENAKILIMDGKEAGKYFGTWEAEIDD